MHREESGGKCVVLDVSSPTTSSCHVEPNEKKPHGKKLLDHYLGSINLATSEKNTQIQSSSDWKVGVGGQVI